MDIISNKNQLFSDICRIIESARGRVAVKANVELTLMYWHIGHRINTDILGNKRAEYGKQIVVTLSRQLKEIYDIKGLDEKNIRRMMQFAEEFPDLQIVTPLVTKLTWSHFVNVLPIKDNIAREFYITMASAEMWSVRVLRDKIDGMLYERTLIAGKDDDKIKQELANLRENNIMNPDLVFKNPYFLDFTGLKGYYSERDLEDMRVSYDVITPSAARAIFEAIFWKPYHAVFTNFCRNFTIYFRISQEFSIFADEIRQRPNVQKHVHRKQMCRRTVYAL